jgi:predicted transcriptional regulator
MSRRRPPLRPIAGGRHERGRVLVLELHLGGDPVSELRVSLRALRGPRGASRGLGAQPISIAAARDLLTWPRLLLLQTIRRERPQSVTGLARLVERSFDAVQEDLTLLERHGLVTLRQPSPRSRVRVPQVPYRQLQLRIDL